MSGEARKAPLDGRNLGERCQHDFQKQMTGKGDPILWLPRNQVSNFVNFFFYGTYFLLLQLRVESTHGSITVSHIVGARELTDGNFMCNEVRFMYHDFSFIVWWQFH